MTALYRLPPPVGAVDRPIPAAGSGYAPPSSPFPQENSTFFHFHPFSQKDVGNQSIKLPISLLQILIFEFWFQQLLSFSDLERN
ncbi:hypothetical protein L2E82_24930 [Cichorium intybus]|uniref:Uncharacterized protein n=1 Tax=Cichorium intybus TaxID=13427 RepID=A0ACB9E1M0_CICIN|nr:hypothetical protein L2E82_24930 [Cichorium intybus]